MSKKIVTIITQNHDITSTLTMALEKSCEIVYFSSWREASDSFRFILNSIKVIFLDIQLPGLSLKECLKELRAISYVPEVIVVSNEPIETEKCKEILSLGAFDCITLPDDNKDIQNSLKSALTNDSVLRKLNLCIGESFPEAFKKRMDIIQDISEQKPIVLAVDDEPGIRRVMTDFLYTRQLVPLLAENGAKAIEIAKANPNIDLFILDIGLPDMDGIDLLTKLKEIVPQAEAIMLTGFQDPERIRNSFKNSAFDYVMKPFKSSELNSIVFKALQRRFFHKILRTNIEVLDTETLPIHARLNILTDIASKKQELGHTLVMEDLYLFFPELRGSGISEDHHISKSIVESGLVHFFEKIKLQTERKVV